MTPSALIPLSEAAHRLGVSPRTWRNILSRARAGLACRPLPPTIRSGLRLFVREQDVADFLAGLSQPPPGDPAGELYRVADVIVTLFPAEAEHLRALAFRVAAPPAAGMRRGVCAPAKRKSEPGVAGARVQPEDNHQAETHPT